MARCLKGSENRAKYAAKFARTHRKVRHARRDFLHRASTRLVRGADTIVIEDLNISGLLKNHGAGPRHLGLRLGRVPQATGVQVRPVRAQPGSDRPVVPVIEGLLGVRALAHRTEPFYPALDVPVPPRPA